MLVDMKIFTRFKILPLQIVIMAQELHVLISAEMEVSEPYYTQIYTGAKSVEGRKMSPKWMNLCPGKVIHITCPHKDGFLAAIVDIHYYHPTDPSTDLSTDFFTKIPMDPLSRYLIEEGLSATLPGITTIEEGRRIYLQWSTQEEINEMGFMGIHLQRYTEYLKWLNK